VRQGKVNLDPEDCRNGFVVLREGSFQGLKRGGEYPTMPDDSGKLAAEFLRRRGRVPYIRFFSQTHWRARFHSACIAGYARLSKSAVGVRCDGREG